MPTLISEFDDESQFIDIFNTSGTPGTPAGGNVAKFGQEERNTDIFAPPAGTPAASTTETTTLAPANPANPAASTTPGKETLLEEADLLGGSPEGDEEKKGPGRPPKYDFTDMTGYFEDRTKNGVFVPLEVENESGEVVAFVPKTPEEYDEFIQYQVEHKFKAGEKDLDQRWYESKSPAWQAVAQYAEKVNHPMELTPFLKGVEQLETVASLNEGEIDGAEKLVRISLGKSGQPQELIDTHIEALKTTNKLVETAQKLKPAMLQAEQQQLIKLQKEADQRDRDYRQMVVDIRNNAIKAIDSPLGKESLKKEEKLAIYELIAEPSPDTKGYAIFDKIDELFDKKDFDKLRKVALLLSNEEAFTKYMTSVAVEKTGAELQRRLRVAGEGRATGRDTGQEPPKGGSQPAQPSYKPQPRFGRG